MNIDLPAAALDAAAALSDFAAALDWAEALSDSATANLMRIEIIKILLDVLKSARTFSWYLLK